MNKFPLPKCCFWIAVALLMVVTVNAQVATNFSDGNDNQAPTNPGPQNPSANSFAGMAGSGWSGGWTSYTFGTPTSSTQVVDYTPLLPTGGRYLLYDFTGTAGQGLHWVRQYANAAGGGVDTGMIHTVSFQFRLDTDIGNRSTSDGSDYIRFFDSTYAGSTGSSSVSWLIAATGGVNNRRWSFSQGDGSGAGGTVWVDTGIDLSRSVVYTFSITVHPVEGVYDVAQNFPTWDATISNGVTSFTETGMRFRNIGQTSGRYLEFGGSVNATERLAYSLDNIQIVAVPEPSTLSFIGLMGALCLGCRRMASSLLSKARRFVREPGFSLMRLGCPIIAMLACLTASAMEVNPLVYDPAVNDRFSSGYTQGKITSPPSANTSTSFLGYGYDLSAIGWNTLDSQQSVTLLSPLHYASASHDPLKLGSTSLTFFTNTGELYKATHQTRVTLNTDAALGTLASPILPSSGVSYLAILDQGDQYNSYRSTALLVYGKYAKIGTARMNYGDWDRASGGKGDTFRFDSVGIRPGDSGSPSFIAYDGQLTLAGTHWSTLSTTGYLGGGDAAWINPYTVAMANTVMGPSGYALKVIAVPTNIWTGAVSGRLDTAGNWTQGRIATREGVAFDGDTAHGHYNLTLGGPGASVSLKGITFADAVSGAGFTFASGNTLQLGTGGLINNSAQTQTFDCDISMYYLISFDTNNPPMVTGAQHWSANKGDFVINGNVSNNGFQLVVDGACDTVINGMIRGAGGLGKEGSGTLTLTAANRYTGRTTITDGTLAVRNTTGSGTGSGSILIYGGTLAGTGSVSGAVTVGSAGALSPGNHGLGILGPLTLRSGVNFQEGAEFTIHLTDSLRYGQLIVTGGNVDLGAATLNLLADDFSAAAGNFFWIINNIGTGSLRGEFAGLANGALVFGDDGSLFRIFYDADYNIGATSGGNDVLLMAVENGVGAADIQLVPEPNSISFLVLAGLFLMRARITYRQAR